MAKYLDYNGLSYFWTKLKATFSLIGHTHGISDLTGVNASTIPYASDNDTNSIKDKVDQIITLGGEPNTIETIKVNNNALTPDANKAVNITVPTNTNQLTNGSNFITAAQAPVQSVNGDTGTVVLDGADIKLDGYSIATGTPAAVAATDTVNTALGKLEKKINDTAATAGVTSIGGQTGAITVRGSQSNNGDVNLTMSGKQIQASIVGFNTKANLASPAFTGTPTAPTASAGTNSTQIATTEFVTTAISAAHVGAATFQGSVSAGTDISSLTNYKSGYYWVVDTDGTYVGQTCEAGDMIYAVNNYSSAYSASDFTVVQNNLISITNAEIDTIVAS